MSFSESLTSCLFNLEDVNGAVVVNVEKLFVT